MTLVTAPFLMKMNRILALRRGGFPGQCHHVASVVSRSSAGIKRDAHVAKEVHAETVLGHMEARGGIRGMRGGREVKMGKGVSSDGREKNCVVTSTAFFYC